MFKTPPESIRGRASGVTTKLGGFLRPTFYFSKRSDAECFGEPVLPDPHIRLVDRLRHGANLTTSGNNVHERSCYSGARCAEALMEVQVGGDSLLKLRV